MLDLITPLILTYNEEANIARTLDKLAWARRIVIVDSGSTDRTLDIVRRYPQAEVIDHPFVNFAEQCNFGLTQIRTPWVLSLDADYELSQALVDEIGALQPAPTISGYRARFVYRIYGHALRGSLYPPRTVLYRVERGRYRNEGHGHRVMVDGSVMQLGGAIYHDDRKPLNRWFESQQRYAGEEAAYLLSNDRKTLNLRDRLRLACLPAPFAALMYALFVKGGILDGLPGWYYALQRAAAEILISIAILDRRLRTRLGKDTESPS